MCVGVGVGVGLGVGVSVCVSVVQPDGLVVLVGFTSTKVQILTHFRVQKYKF